MALQSCILNWILEASESKHPVERSTTSKEHVRRVPGSRCVRRRRIVSNQRYVGLTDMNVHNTRLHMHVHLYVEDSVASA